jgi:hypothetical protein
MRQKLSEFCFPEIFRAAGATVDHQRLYRQSLNRQGGVNTPHVGLGIQIVFMIPLVVMRAAAGFCI